MHGKTERLYGDQDFGARVAVTMGERLVLALEILCFVGR